MNRFFNMLFAEYSTAFFLKRQASRSHKFNIPHSLQECSGLFQVVFLCIPLRERHTCGHRLLAHADCVSTYSTEVMWSRVIRPTAFWNEKQRDLICLNGLSSGLGQLGSLSLTGSAWEPSGLPGTMKAL